MFTRSANTQTCLCGCARLLPSPCRYSADTHKPLGTELLLSSAPPWQTGEARAAPTPLAHSRSPLSSQEPGIWRPLWLSSPLSQPGTFPTRCALCSNYWGKPSARWAPEVPRLMASMLDPSSTALVSASTMQNCGISILPASLLPGLSGSFPFILLGKMEKAKSWQNPIRKTPVFMEAVLNKFYRSMEAEVDPSTSTSTWKIHSSLCFTLGIVYPSPLCPAEPVLSLLCCGTSQSTTSAFRSLSVTEDQACHILVSHPAKSLNFSAFNNPHTMVHFQT